MTSQGVWVLLLFAVMVCSGCEEAKQAGKAIVKKGIEHATQAEGGVNNAAGLKAALEAGVGKAVGALAQKGGFANNPKMRIPFPPKAQAVADKLRQLGLGALVDGFVDMLNRAAEDAVAKAKPIFVAAIKKMTIQDARVILFGASDAATRYFETHTREQLYATFKPVIKDSLDRIGAATQWAKVVGKYNSIPFVKKVNADLPDYATHAALDRLFIKIAAEELLIRNDPKARTTELLKNVFGQLDRR